MKTSETIAKLASALAKAQGQMRAAAKDSVNPHFKSRYADLAGVWDACREPLAANGLAIMQSPGEIGDKNITLTTMLAHESGEWIQSQFTIPVSKPDAQGVGSAITYARRYALAAMVGIVQDDDDGNAASAPRKTVAVRRVDDVQQETPFDLQLALVAITKAESLDLLKAVYADAYNAADAIGDQTAITALVRAKDARKAALAQQPSKLKGIVAPEQPQDDVL
jgi:hypothetical protein